MTDERDPAGATATAVASETLGVDGERTASGNRYLAPATELPVAGSAIGRFNVDRVLGHGGEGVVLAAHDPLLDRPVAIKLLRRERRRARARLLAEGKAIAKLRHPNVVTVYDIGLHDADLFIAMELVEGQNLRAWLAAGRRPWPEVIACLVQAGRGLAAAHAAGLVHGDFKPENVLIGQAGHVVVGDFGLARVAMAAGTADGAAAPDADAEVEVDATGPIAGTPAYLAPEQWAGKLGDARADVFAFCVTLHEALYGQRPFERPGAGQQPIARLAEAVQANRRVAPADRRGVPKRIERALDRGLALDPAARFATMAALLVALEPPRRRWRWLVPALAAATVAGAAAIIFTRADPARARAAACAVEARRVDAVWTPAARADYLARGAAQPWAAEQAGWLDGFARDWSAASASVCARGTGAETSPPRVCLDRALAALGAAAAADAAGWPRLPSITDCLRAPMAPRPQAIALPFGTQGDVVLSPDGREVAVTNYARDAFVLTLDAPFVPRPVPGAWAVLDWLPDGRLYTLDRDLRLQLRAPDGTTEDVDRLDGFVPQASRVAPDGGAYTIERDDGLELRARPGRTPIAAMPGVANAAWSPDSRRVVGSLVGGDLLVYDRRTRTSTRISVRSAMGAVGIRQIAWTGPDRLVLPGAFGAGDRSAVWSIVLDDANQLAGAPLLRLEPSDDLMYVPADAHGDRVALKRYSAQKRIFHLHGGRTEELPVAFNDADVRGYDPARGVVLAVRAHDAFVFAVAGREPTAVEAGGGPLILRGGVIAAVRERGAGQWALVERAPADAAETERVRFAWDVEQVALACSARAPDRCVVYGRRADRLVVAPLKAAGPGAAHDLEGVSGPPGLTTDGRVVVPRWDGTVRELDLATGRSLGEHRVAEANCSALRAGWLHDERGLWSVVACPDRFGIVTVTSAGTREVFTADGWISGVAALPQDELIYSLLDLDPRLFIVDGL